MKRYNALDAGKVVLVEMMEQRHQKEMQRQLDAFAKRHKHFEKVRVTMGGLIVAGKAFSLPEAYKLAVPLYRRGKRISKQPT